MITTRFLFLLFISFFATQIGWVANASASAADEVKEQEQRVACIRILPHNPFSSDEEERKVQADPPDGFEAYPGDNTFGIRQMFDYKPPEDIKDLQHKQYLEAVCKYQTNFGKKNVLLTRMRIFVEGDEEPYEYLFGIFTSGGDEYYSGTVLDWLEPNQQSKQQDKVIEPPFMDIARKIKAKDLLSRNDELRELVKRCTLQLSGDDLGEVVDGRCYKVETFQLDGQAVKLAPVSSGELGNLKLLGKIVGERVFSHNDPVFNDYLQSRDKKLREVCINSYRVLANPGDISSAFREQLTLKIYGKPCYAGKGNCFGKNNSFGLYFNQSEQVFLSFLEGHLEESDDHIHAKRKLEDESEYVITGVRFDLYSSLDICRYCRGTLSWSLANGNIARILRGEWFKNLLADETHMNTEILSEIDAIELYAFSRSTTDIN